MDKPKIHVFTDESCEMMRIEHNGECVFEGNLWDFPDDGDLPRFLRSLGFSVTEEGYSYE